eukprot:7384244-Prymnesium_polylepis.2
MKVTAGLERSAILGRLSGHARCRGLQRDRQQSTIGPGRAQLHPRQRDRASEHSHRIRVEGNVLDAIARSIVAAEFRAVAGRAQL